MAEVFCTWNQYEGHENQSKAQHEMTKERMS